MRRRTAQTGSAFGLEVRSPPHLLVLPDAGRRSSRRTSIDACAAGDLDRRWATADAPERLLERRFLNGRLVMSVDVDPDLGYRIYAPRAGRHLVSHDGAHIGSAVPRIAPWRWQRLLFAQVLPLAATLRGLELLHASAVELEGRTLAFVARAGTGKTSLAAHLVVQGAALVTDDVLAVEWAGDRIVGYPGAPTLSIARHELDRVPRERRARLGTTLGEADKVVLAAPVVDGPRVLGALYFLDRPEGRRIRIEPLESDPLRVVASSFNVYVRSAARIENQLETAARVTSSVAMYSITIPAGAIATDVARSVAAHAGVDT